ncbi:MAG: hypothetical protein ACXVUE_24055 [Solirubrobacteraceae bacterium]
MRTLTSMGAGGGVGCATGDKKVAAGQDQDTRFADVAILRQQRRDMIEWPVGAVREFSNGILEARIADAWSMNPDDAHPDLVSPSAPNGRSKSDLDLSPRLRFSGVCNVPSGFSIVSIGLLSG